MRSKKLIIVLVMVLLVPAFVVARNAVEAVLTDMKHHAQVTLPDGWVVGEPQKDTGIVLAKNEDLHGHAQVVSESKEDFTHKNIAEYAGAVLKIEEAKTKLKDRQVSEPRKLEVNGMPAVQYEVHGAAQNTKLVYLKTFIETPNRWNQVVCWTIPSHWDECQPGFKSIYESLKETSGTGK
jgi:hypothetical protein